MNQNFNNLEYFKLFLDTFNNLINIIENSIKNYYINNSDQNPQSNWKTPKPWENKVLKNLENRKILIEEAYQQFKLNNRDLTYDIASDISALGKDLDNFNSEWMSTDDSTEYEKNLDLVVLIASNIERSF